MSNREHGLCCCEYISDHGNRSHILAICCDCKLIDETFERCITCKSQPPDLMIKIGSMMSDRCRIPWCDGRGARKIEFSIIIPTILIPIIFIIAAQGWLWTIITFIFLPIFLIMIQIKCLKHQIRTKFFLSWTISSLVFLLCVFEFEVVPYLEILFIENFVLMCFVSIMCLCGYFVKFNHGILKNPNVSMSDIEYLRTNEQTLINIEESSKCGICNIVQPARCGHCRLCGHCVLRRDHHCIWLDTCIGAKNHRTFIIGLLAMFIACIYGSMLTLTTICHPILIFETVLVPDNCTDVYEDI
ncbi:palmitoyltransferase ZDHHC23-like [Centruroides sculpturatus]|uniref:palmitoyltransferase ZDHHC23-like n=1 Tax=Centruroides sculpturatus TaxID=218467 RepID=UPI000C6D892F|nr:palmitoyltransferase ZDHHC23-like [Centruroides sculpturatus]